MTIFFFFLIVVIGAIIVLKIRKGRTGARDDTVATQSQSIPDGIDSWNIPAYFSADKQEELKKIAEYYGVRYVTGKETQKWIFHNLSEDFAAMPGWDVWDSSIHEASGQYERAERGSSGENISILCYDPKYKIAKIQGKTGIYLTSCSRCSCPDFRKRQLPCKHMYALAFELDGDVQKEILDPNHEPLYGLVLALAGHLPKSSKGVGGIRAEISDRGGKWSDDIDGFDSSAVVVGTDPSVRRLDRIKSFDIECLTPESVKDIFSSHEISSEN